MMEVGSSKGKAKAATVLPAKKKLVSTRMGEVMVGSVTKVAKNMKNKNKITWSVAITIDMKIEANRRLHSPFFPIAASRHMTQSQGNIVNPPVYGRVHHISANDDKQVIGQEKASSVESPKKASEGVSTNMKQNDNSKPMALKSEKSANYVLRKRALINWKWDDVVDISSSDDEVELIDMTQSLFESAHSEYDSSDTADSVTSFHDVFKNR
ncbi:hypothetical protein L1987_86448 [Smallanthus sonchifolius]|uniref:Uncharacterized protein n=1 Tax=Smallanthus sonchifolius TaxID=185202 RepID=A0ACB8Y0X5_9ASTR|nr:hypothetical protein L1987_86448 [Smallanthus sonchifolius]